MNRTLRPDSITSCNGSTHALAMLTQPCSLVRVRFEEMKEEAAVKVSADGKIVEPEPEKSFLQKYW